MKMPKINFRAVGKFLVDQLPRSPLDAFVAGWEVGGWLYDLVTPDLVSDQKEQDILRELKKRDEEEPKDTYIKCPPKPYNNIKPPPAKIYEPPPPSPDVYDIDLPELPKRALPKPPSTSSNTEATYASAVDSSLIEREFGCLFAKPFYTEAIEWCNYDVPKDFWSQLLTAMKEDIEEYYQALEDGDGYPNIRMNAWLSLPQPFVDSPILLRTTRGIDELAYMYYTRVRELGNYPLTGMLSTKGVQLQTCTQQLASQPYDEVIAELPSLQSFPLTSFDDNEGIKYDQLHIIWKDLDKTSRYTRTTVLPLPLDPDDITGQLLRDTLPETMDFGSTIYDLLWKIPEEAVKIPDLDDVVFKQKANTFIYGTGESDDDYKTFIDDSLKEWVSALCKDSLELARWQIKQRDNDTQKDIYEGTFYPFRAICYGWDIDKDAPEGKKATKWIVKAEWYIRKHPDDEN